MNLAEQPYLTTAEAATLTRLSESTIKKAVAAGALRVIQHAPGGKWVISRKAIDAWLESMEVA